MNIVSELYVGNGQFDGSLPTEFSQGDLYTTYYSLETLNALHYSMPKNKDISYESWINHQISGHNGLFQSSKTPIQDVFFAVGSLKDLGAKPSNVTFIQNQLNRLYDTHGYFREPGVPGNNSSRLLDTSNAIQVLEWIDPQYLVPQRTKSWVKGIVKAHPSAVNVFFGDLILRSQQKVLGNAASSNGPVDMTQLMMQLAVSPRVGEAQSKQLSRMVGDGQLDDGTFPAFLTPHNATSDIQGTFDAVTILNTLHDSIPKRQELISTLLAHETLDEGFTPIYPTSPDVASTMMAWGISDLIGIRGVQFHTPPIEMLSSGSSLPTPGDVNSTFLLSQYVNHPVTLPMPIIYGSLNQFLQSGKIYNINQLQTLYFCLQVLEETKKLGSLPKNEQRHIAELVLPAFKLATQSPYALYYITFIATHFNVPSRDMQSLKETLMKTYVNSKGQLMVTGGLDPVSIYYIVSSMKLLDVSIHQKTVIDQLDQFINHQGGFELETGPQSLALGLDYLTYTYFGLSALRLLES